MSRKPVRRLRGLGGGIRGVDPEIRPLVMDLNAHGYGTYASCAGDEYLTAELVFELGSPPFTRDEWEDIKDIVRSHTDVPFHIIKESSTSNASIVFRRPLGVISEWTSEFSPYMPESRLMYLSPEERGRESWPDRFEITDEDIKEVLGDESFWDR